MKRTTSSSTFPFNRTKLHNPKSKTKPPKFEKLIKSNRIILFQVIQVKLPVIPARGDEKLELLSQIVSKLESREAKKLLARNGISPVNKAVEYLKVMAMFFELEISYAVSELNKRSELRKFLRLREEIKLRSIYSFMSKFEAEQFISLVFSILVL
ncbi:transposase, putative [Archaeoglobus fulgidus DSM 4304]|uniref:Transposase, putative n=2 Tax=Archaeoglobus fulgidus TaxID=2234 RepID=O30100_ARCFU|nr:transposase, putative [Archaeoglobus fulgidus DSM 4304]